jgi:hypothetical protein
MTPPQARILATAVSPETAIAPYTVGRVIGRFVRKTPRSV